MLPVNLPLDLSDGELMTAGFVELLTSCSGDDASYTDGPILVVSFLFSDNQVGIGPHVGKLRGGKQQNSDP